MPTYSEVGIEVGILACASRSYSNVGAHDHYLITIENAYQYDTKFNYMLKIHKHAMRAKWASRCPPTDPMLQTVYCRSGNTKSSTRRVAVNNPYKWSTVYNDSIISHCVQFVRHDYLRNLSHTAK